MNNKSSSRHVAPSKRTSGLTTLSFKLYSHLTVKKRQYQKKKGTGYCYIKKKFASPALSRTFITTDFKCERNIRADSCTRSSRSQKLARKNPENVTPMRDSCGFQNGVAYGRARSIRLNRPASGVF